MITVDTTAIISGTRFGFGETISGGWNANTIGLLSLNGFILSIMYYLIYKRNQKKARFWFLIVAAMCVVLMVFCGSRRSVLGLLFCILVFIRFSVEFSKKKYKVYFTVFIILAMSIIYLSTNETAYNLIGHRLGAIIDGLFRGGTREGSFNQRVEMITFGLSEFIKRPFTGSGYLSYFTLYQNAYGLFQFAHNNYIELLVDLGIIGFIMYYSGYFTAIRKMSITCFRENYYTYYIRAMLITNMFLHISNVGFNEYQDALILLFAFIAIKPTVGNIVQTGVYD